MSKASAVLLTSNQPSKEGFKSIVAEIVKIEPGTTIEYKVGDEFPHLGGPRHEKDGTTRTYGDGNVVFLAGSPAMMRCAYSFDNGRITGLGDMSLETLRRVAGKKAP